MNDKRENDKRKHEKDFDVDLDSGRMKKKRRHNGERDNPTYNAFQEHQNRNQRGSQQHHRRPKYTKSPYYNRIPYTNKSKY